MSKRIRKAVFPVAGLGTRFLPATKTVPKEMLPIIDRPLIQYAVDEAIEAGCDTLIWKESPADTMPFSKLMGVSVTKASIPPARCKACSKVALWCSRN